MTVWASCESCPMSLRAFLATRLPNMRKCPKCGISREEMDFLNQAGVLVKRCVRCRSQGVRDPVTAAREKAYRQGLRKQVFDHYGWSCQCCGEDEPIFLTIDHVNNDGHEARKLGLKGGGYTYRLIIRAGFPDTYQVLCFNCNRGRWLNGGVCPHQMP